MEQQLRNLRSRLQFADHELQQAKRCDDISQPIPQHKLSQHPQSMTKSKSMEKLSVVENKFLLKTNQPSSKIMDNLEEKCSLRCPKTNRVLSFNLAIGSTLSPLFNRILNHLIEITKLEGVILSDRDEHFTQVLQVLAKFLFSKTTLDAFLYELCENIAVFLSTPDIVKVLLSNEYLHEKSLQICSCLFLISAESESEEGMKQLTKIWQRIFESVLPSLLTPSSFQPARNLSLFSAAVDSLSSASFHFNVIDLRSFLADCPLHCVASSFLEIFAKSTSDSATTFSTSILTEFVRLITRACTFSNDGVDRFIAHPCRCQPLVVACLANIGLRALEYYNERFNCLLIAVLNCLFLFESHRGLRSINHLPIFYLFLTKLELLVGDASDDQSEFFNAKISNISQVLITSLI